MLEQSKLNIVLQDYVKERSIADIIESHILCLNHLEKFRNINYDIKQMNYIFTNNSIRSSYIIKNRLRTYFFVRYNNLNFTMLFTRDTNIIETYIKTLVVNNISSPKIVEMFKDIERMLLTNFSEITSESNDINFPLTMFRNRSFPSIENAN
jgi:hypothetical protein